MTCFKKPTVKEIAIYMASRGFNTNLDENWELVVDDDGKPVIKEDQDEMFYDHFESKGWMVGKSKMKCWKASIRNWIRNAKKWSKRDEASQRSNQTHSQRQHEQAQQAFSEMEAGNTEGSISPIRQIQ